MLRLITALLLILGLWATIKLAPAELFIAVALVVISIAVWESYGMLEARGSRPFRLLGVLAGAGVVWTFHEPGAQFALHALLALAVVLTLVLALWRRGTPEEMLDAATSTLFPLLVVALGLGFLVALHGLPGKDGEDLLLLLFVCVVFADTAAFYFGRALGRHRMTPTISPSKTWEGAVAGVLASTLASVAVQTWFFPSLTLVHALVLGPLLGLAAILGDLSESMIKRACRVKDSSALLPGHGGVLDRIDSLLLAGPLIYFYYRWLIQGTV